jgi:hypothetical protein
MADLAAWLAHSIKSVLPMLVVKFHQAAVRQFAVTYNREWLLERHGDRTPTEARAHLAALAQAPIA